MIELILTSESQSVCDESKDYMMPALAFLPG